MTPVIDVHVHLYPPRRLSGLMRWIHRGIPGHPVPADVSVEGIVADLRRAGVRAFFSVPFPLAPGEARLLNRFNADLARSVPEMIPFGTAHQDDPDPGAVAAEAVGPLGLAGIKLHPMMMKLSPGDPRMAGVFAVAQEAGVPALVHTGFEESYGRTAEKEAWEGLFRAFPRLDFILAHAFFPDLPYAFSLPDRFGNVFLDLTNVPGMLLWPEGPLPFGVSRPSWGREEFARAVEAAGDRVLFGSDHPAGMGTLAGILGQVAALGLSSDCAGKVLYGNARDLIGRHTLA